MAERQFVVSKITNVHKLARAAGTVAFPHPSVPNGWVVGTHVVYVDPNVARRNQVIVMDVPALARPVDPVLAWMHQEQERMKDAFRDAILREVAAQDGGEGERG
jgi:hypothetical protein